MRTESELGRSSDAAYGASEERGARRLRPPCRPAASPQNHTLDQQKLHFRGQARYSSTSVGQRAPRWQGITKTKEIP